MLNIYNDKELKDSVQIICEDVILDPKEKQIINPADLTSVNIPEDVKEIGTGAFLGCTSDLTFAGKPKEFVEKSGFAGENRIQPQRVAEQSELRPAQQTRSL